MKNLNPRVRWLVILAIGAGVFLFINSRQNSESTGQDLTVSPTPIVTSAAPVALPSKSPEISPVLIQPVPAWKDVAHVDDRFERFPEGILVQEYDAPIPGSSMREHIQILKVEMKNPLIRITDRRMVSKDGAVMEVKDRLIMIADQTIVQKPEEISESEFEQIVTTAGAKVLRALSTEGPYVIGFDTSDNPKKLDEVIAALKSLSHGKITADPDFVRFTD